ncbi:MAG: YebC/PmpR family DNA-binding transcriptional regulator [Candidatus Paracaedibacteraceae bacterium]|nr:YebC/PmpR family DNA-binding transcriptional regulator [Candidatus Paracaedibacteraceae bacterium]
MAGHSQFKNIMYRKGAQDAKRARMFAKITREIIVSARIGADPSSNPRLRAAMAAARAANMPKDNVDRAIKKALGGEDTANYEEVRYEGYGPGGTALIVESLTDNRNRTASEVRTAFTKCGGNMGETGSVAFMFDRVGVIRLSKTVGSYDDVFEKAVDAGADNLEEEGDFYEVLTGLDNFALVRDALSQSYEDISESKLIWRPQNTISVDEEAAQKIIKLIDTLEDSDDVQNVYCNFEVSDDILAKLS